VTSINRWLSSCIAVTATVAARVVANEKTIKNNADIEG